MLGTGIHKMNKNTHNPYIRGAYGLVKETNTIKYHTVNCIAVISDTKEKYILLRDEENRSLRD